MKIIVPVAVAAVLALGACSQGEDKAVEPAAAVPAAEPAAPAGLARTAFAGLPESCMVLADKMDRLRGCASRMVAGQLTPEQVAQEEAGAKTKAEAMATDLRNLPAGEAAEACTANHDLMEKMGQAMVGDC
ncbi:hypothetical protein [Brevundimonas sp. GCM10030266]|uniref:hypothetical protein n=1 Tax=Brevundimonas sp. GCM10030266 TaxID=3273386 RepID=UPI0036109D9C